MRRDWKVRFRFCFINFRVFCWRHGLTRRREICADLTFYICITKSSLSFIKRYKDLYIFKGPKNYIWTLFLAQSEQCALKWPGRVWTKPYIIRKYNIWRSTAHKHLWDLWMGVTPDDQMDPLDFLSRNDLLKFFHRKKTEISCIEDPHTFLNQLRDHDLVPEDLYQAREHHGYFIRLLNHLN